MDEGKRLHIVIGANQKYICYFALNCHKRRPRLHNFVCLFVVHGVVVVLVVVNQEEVDRRSASCLTFTLRSELLEDLGFLTFHTTSSIPEVLLFRLQGTSSQ